jgi:hypothetical protein
MRLVFGKTAKMRIVAASSCGFADGLAVFLRQQMAQVFVRLHRIGDTRQDS